MKRINLDRKANRKSRHLKTLRRIRLVDNGLPKLTITKTSTHIYVQLVDTNSGKTIASSSSLQLKLNNGNVENSTKVGEDISRKTLSKNITEVSFDRNGFKYHGRVAAIAIAARKAGLKF